MREQLPEQVVPICLPVYGRMVQPVTMAGCFACVHGKMWLVLQEVRGINWR